MQGQCRPHGPQTTFFGMPTFLFFHYKIKTVYSLSTCGKMLNGKQRTIKVAEVKMGPL